MSDRRWTIQKLETGDRIKGPLTYDIDVMPVPDEAAIERAMQWVEANPGPMSYEGWVRGVLAVL